MGDNYRQRLSARVMPLQQNTGPMMFCYYCGECFCLALRLQWFLNEPNERLSWKWCFMHNLLMQYDGATFLDLPSDGPQIAEKLQKCVNVTI